MRLVAALTAVALFAMYFAVNVAIPPQALQQDDTRASTADLIHPPTSGGSSAIAAPENGRR